MPRIEDAKIHLDEAMQHLRIEAYRVEFPDDPEGRPTETPLLDFTIAMELERIDQAIGPRGKSMFASLADNVRSAYVEIKAARQALDDHTRKEDVG